MSEPNVPELFVDAFERADRAIALMGYHSVSVPTEGFRAWLRRRRLPFVDPLESRVSSLYDLDHTAGLVIHRSARAVGAVGAAAGLGGVATIPSEWVAANVASLRMAQRLCIVYGFDPTDDRGQVALCQVLGAAFGIDLPITGILELRISEIPGLLWSRTPALNEVPAKLVRAMAQSTMWWIAGRITRFVPVVSASTHAVESRRAMETAGRAMQAVLERLAEAPAQAELSIEDAYEIG